MSHAEEIQIIYAATQLGGSASLMAEVKPGIRSGIAPLTRAVSPAALEQPLCCKKESRHTNGFKIEV